MPSRMIDPFSTQRKVLESSKEGSIDKTFKTLQRPFYYVKALEENFEWNWRTPYIYEEDLKRNLTSTSQEWEGLGFAFVVTSSNGSFQFKWYGFYFVLFFFPHRIISLIH